MTSAVVAGIVLALFVAASTFLVVRGLGRLLRLKWRGVLGVLGGLGLLLLTLVLITWFTTSLRVDNPVGPPFSPTTYERIVSENFKMIASVSSLGLPLGLLAGTIAALGDRRRDRAKAGR